ncbi:MAG: hypothetical protein Q8P41_14525 [Pseudomonadota bacterium]|nr:hypothetical protein [Pseudomonadota bacterium]
MLTKVSFVECTPKRKAAGLCQDDASAADAPTADPVIVTDPNTWMPPDFLDLLKRLGVEVQDGVLYVTELRIALWDALVHGRGDVSVGDLQQVAAALTALSKSMRATSAKESKGAKGLHNASRRQKILRYAAAIDTLATAARRVRVAAA